MDDLWAAYWNDRTIENRNAIVVENLPLVWSLVKPMLKRAKSLHKHDLLSYGVIGLIHAVENFSPERAQFSTYAHECIRCQMASGIDGFINGRRANAGAREFYSKVRAMGKWEYDLASETQDLDSRLDIEQALNRLSEPQRKAIVLCVFEGLTRHQAASVLGVANSTFDTYIDKGKKRMRSMLSR